MRIHELGRSGLCRRAAAAGAEQRGDVPDGPRPVGAPGRCSDGTRQDARREPFWGVVGVSVYMHKRECSHRIEYVTRFVVCLCLLQCTCFVLMPHSKQCSCAHAGRGRRARDVPGPEGVGAQDLRAGLPAVLRRHPKRQPDALQGARAAGRSCGGSLPVFWVYVGILLVHQHFSVVWECAWHFRSVYCTRVHVLYLSGSVLTVRFIESRRHFIAFRYYFFT